MCDHNEMIIQMTKMLDEDGGEYANELDHVHDGGVACQKIDRTVVVLDLTIELVSC